MTRRQTGIGLALATAGSLALFWLTNLPLGVSGEWVWSRIPVAPREAIVLALGCVVALVFGGVYLGIILLAARRIETASRRETGVWLAALVAGGFAWLWAVQESPARVENALGKSGWVLYWPAHEGYFDQARNAMKDTGSYLATYEQRMAQGDVLHLGTHPPGLMLFHGACLEVCGSFAGLRGVILRTQPASFREALDAADEIQRKSGRPITPADRAALWLACLITQVVAAGTVVPIFLLVRRTGSRSAGWWAAALWPMVPSLAIFLPKSDALFPFFGAMFLWTWLEGFRRGSPAMCFLAGIIFWLAMLMSLAILPVAIAAALLIVWETCVCPMAERLAVGPRDFAARLGAALAAWGGLILIMRLAAHINLIAVWWWNYRNHAAFYGQYPRTYWKWLLVNPLELFLGVGAPIILAAVLGFRSVVAGGWRSRAAGPYWCLTVAWMVLWLSGKNMGEAGRLWLVIMPWPVCLTAGYLSHPPVSLRGRSDSGPPNSGQRQAWAGVALVLFQMAACLGTVTRVTGFDFPEMPVKQTLRARESLPDARFAQGVSRLAAPNGIDRPASATR